MSCQYSSESERFRTVPNYSSQAASIKFRPVPNGSRTISATTHRCAGSVVNGLHDLICSLPASGIACWYVRSSCYKNATRTICQSKNKIWLKSASHFFNAKKAKRWLQRAEKHLTHGPGNWALWCSKAQFCKPGPSQCSTHSEIWERGKPYYKYYTKP